MVQPVGPAFLDLETGKVVGEPAPATRRATPSSCSRRRRSSRRSCTPRADRTSRCPPHPTAERAGHDGPGVANAQARQEPQPLTARSTPVDGTAHLDRRAGRIQPASRPEHERDQCRATRTRRGASRGAPMMRLRVGFVVDRDGAVVLRCPAGPAPGHRPAARTPPMAAAEGAVEVALPAERGDILDRNGVPLADSVDGQDGRRRPDDDRRPTRPSSRRFLSRPARRRLLHAPSPRCAAQGGQPLRVRRPPGARAPWPATCSPSSTTPASRASALARRPDARLPRRRRGRQPGRLHRHRRAASAGFERTFDKQLVRHRRRGDVRVRRQGNRIPLRREHHRQAAYDGAALRTTIDRDLQWFTQRVLAQTVRSTARRLGVAVVMDTRTGELLALADYPTFDANAPTEADEDDLGSRALQRRLRAGLGREGADRVLADRRRQGHARARSFEVPPSLAPPGPGDRRLVRPRQHPAHAGRRHREVVQHRHRARRRRVQPRRAVPLPAEVRPRPAHRHRRARRDAPASSRPATR